MKYIKQKSTGKIVYRDQPHSEKSLDNAVLETGIAKSDLEIVESDWTEDEWNNATKNQMPYDEKRKREYDQLNQFELIGEDAINGTTNHVDAIKAIKTKYPKE